MEPEVLYEIGPNDCATSVISLKANTRLLRDVSESWNSFIEFTSETTCRITCDDEEFELTLTEAMPMVRWE